MEIHCDEEYSIDGSIATASTWSIPTLKDSDDEDECSIDSASTWMSMPGLAEPIRVSSSFLCNDCSDKDEAPLSTASAWSMPTLTDCSSDDDDDSMPALEDPSSK